MSNRKRATHRKSKTDMRFTVSNQSSVEFTADAYQDLFKIGATLGAESVRFWCKRLEEDLSLCANLMRCHTTGAALEAQASFCQTMATDYCCEPSKLLELLAPRSQVPKCRVSINKEQRRRHRSLCNTLGHSQ